MLFLFHERRIILLEAARHRERVFKVRSKGACFLRQLELLLVLYWLRHQIDDSRDCSCWLSLSFCPRAQIFPVWESEGQTVPCSRACLVRVFLVRVFLVRVLHRLLPIPGIGGKPGNCERVGPCRFKSNFLPFYHLRRVARKGSYSFQKPDEDSWKPEYTQNFSLMVIKFLSIQN